MATSSSHPNGEMDTRVHDTAPTTDVVEADEEEEDWPEDMAEVDPWQEAAEARRQASLASQARAPPQRSSGPVGPRNGGVFVEGQVGRSGFEGPPARIVHDSPPVWNGTKAEDQAEPYLKLLQGWLATTRTIKTQQV